MDMGAGTKTLPLYVLRACLEMSGLTLNHQKLTVIAVP